jgi:chitodextrinase
VATSFSDTSVLASTAYSYTVAAMNGAGQSSAQSAALAVTTPAPAGCSAATLIAAVAAANAASGGGTVTLQNGCLYTLTAADNSTDGGTGLPVITGVVTVQGNGATIARSSAAGTPHFRMFDVASGGSLTVNAVTFTGGIADNGQDGGGAIYNHGMLAVSASTFTSNTSEATSGTSGGAINNSGTMTVTTSNFNANIAMEGGGVFNQNTSTITQSTFTNNAATIYGGGAILNAFGTTTVDGSTFVGNTGPGGGVVDNDTTINISNSTFFNNTGGNHGGGAIQNFGIANITTSTLSGNSSPYGSDIYNYGSSTATVSSSIVADGLSSGNCGGTPIIDGGYNLDTGSSCGFTASKNSKSNTRPQLQPLASNGGPTQTMALTPGSPAINVIPAAVSGCAGTTDQRGTARPQGPACDIGAYEQVSISNDTQPPTTPTGLATTSTGTGNVILGWNAASDNVGVVGYTVYRDGVAQGTIGGSVTSFTDSTAASATTYAYTVDAFDAAGNRSPQSAPLSVTTTTGPPPSPHWIQGAVAGSGSKVASLTLQLNPVTAGDLLVGWFGQYDSAGPVQVSDDVNGAWTRAAPSTTFSSGAGDIALFYVQNAAAAPGGVTVTIASTAATYLQGSAAEYAGVARTNSLDQMAIGHGTSAAADSSPTGSVAAGELLFSGLMTGAAPGTAAVNNGLVSHDHNGSFSVDDADGVAAAGPQHVSWTLANSADWYTVTAVFHTAAGP